MTDTEVEWDSGSEEAEHPKMSFRRAIQLTKAYLAKVLQRQRETAQTEDGTPPEDQEQELPDPELRARLSIATQRINASLQDHISGNVPPLPPLPPDAMQVDETQAPPAHQAQPAPRAQRRHPPAQAQLQQRSKRGSRKGHGGKGRKGKAKAKGKGKGCARTAGRMLGPKEYWAQVARPTWEHAVGGGGRSTTTTTTTTTTRMTQAGKGGMTGKGGGITKGKAGKGGAMTNPMTMMKGGFMTNPMTGKGGYMTNPGLTGKGGFMTNPMTMMMPQGKGGYMTNPATMMRPKGKGGFMTNPMTQMPVKGGGIMTNPMTMGKGGFMTNPMMMGKGGFMTNPMTGGGDMTNPMMMMMMPPNPVWARSAHTAEQRVAQLVLRGLLSQEA